MENIKYIGLLIKRIDDAIGKTVNKELKEKDATFSQMHMLWALKNTKGGTLTLKELEKFLRLAQPTTLGIAKRLEEKGFVEGSFRLCRQSEPSLLGLLQREMRSAETQGPTWMKPKKDSLRVSLKVKGYCYTSCL